MSFFQPATPLTWSFQDKVMGGNLFPYRVIPNRPVFAEEIKHIKAWCHDMYGPRFLTGGDGYSLWSNELYRDAFLFRHETDATMFIVAMSGLSIGR